MSTALDFGPFLALPDGARGALAGSGRLGSVPRGQRLISAGDEPAAAFAVLRGRVRVVDTGGNTVATLAAPAVVGEMAVLEGRPHRSDVVALTGVRALRIDAGALRDLVASDDGFARTLASFADARRTDAFLRRQGPFGGLPSDEVERLAARLRPFRARKGDVLMRQGERGDEVLLIRDGEVEVIRSDGATERILARLGPGSLVGEIAALTGSPRTATVRARTDLDALIVRGDDVRAVVRRHRDLLHRVASVMQSRHTPRRTGEHRVETAPDDRETLLLHDPERGVYLRLDRQALAIYEDLDGERTLRDLALRHFDRTGTLDPQAVFATVAALQASGFATVPRIATDTLDARVLRVADAVLAPRAEIADADPLASALYRVLRPVFTRGGAVAAAACGVIGVAVALPRIRGASPLDFGLGGIFVAFVALLVAGIGHEVSHALAAKAEGTRIGRAGFGLFWFAPVAYVDTSATWAIPRWGRIRVNAAGPLFNLALAGAAGLVTLVAGGTAADVLVWIAIANVVLVVFNLSPLLEFDGYYVLADLTDTNALRRKALRFVFRDLVDRPRRPASRREVGFVAYAAAALLYVVVMSAVVLAGVPGVMRAVLPAAIDDAMRAAIGAAVALALTVLLVTPFVLEAFDARTSAEPGLA